MALKVNSVEVEVSSEGLGINFDRQELWFDEPNDRGLWGAILRISSGYVVRPVPKFWKLRKENYGKYSWPNPWTSGDHWFVIRFKFFFCPFISAVFRDYGIYLGFKTAGYGTDWPWKKPGREGDILVLSGSLRRTRII